MASPDIEQTLEIQSSMDGEVDNKPQKYNFSSRQFWIGDYDYKYLCMPVFPYTKAGRTRPPAHFFARDDHLGVVTALIMGGQHALAMLGGLITPPLLIVPYSAPNRLALQAYLVQAAIICAGIMTLVQVTGWQPVKRYMFQWGSGILSVMGVTFACVPIVTAVLATIMATGDTFEVAYGNVLGTLAVCAVAPLILSFVPIRGIKYVFPPVVTGVTIMLIGISLCGVGLEGWGGGVYCSENIGDPSATPSGAILCDGNGDVQLPFGSPQYVGLGLLTFLTIILVEIFGSPFMRNCSAMLGLLTGYAVSAIVTHDGNRYVTGTAFAAAPWATFLWTTTFPLSFYGPAVFPLLIVFCVTCVESVGDTTATLEASREPASGELFAMRVKGALFNDGMSGIFSALATSLPLTTFAQNNGIISLTNVASRQAGWACGGWLILIGILGKFGAFITSIPDCVLGGMTTFLFANVIASGIKIIVAGEGNLDRRTRFIMAAALSIGVGVSICPQWASTWLWPVTPGMSSGLVGVRNAVILILDTGFCIGALISCILNLIMPREAGPSDALLELSPAPTADNTVHKTPGPMGIKLTLDEAAIAASTAGPSGVNAATFHRMSHKTHDR